MIKLIASDMDGTLLDEHSEVPAETFGLIRELREAGVHFAASSGRSFSAPVMTSRSDLSCSGFALRM